MTKHWLAPLFGAILSVGAFAGSAEAATWKLEYDTGTTGIIQALVEGTLQADNNTVQVTGISGLQNLGLGYIVPATGVRGVSISSTYGTLTLDGSDVSLFVEADPIDGVGQGMFMAPGPFNGPLKYSFQGKLGGLDGAFNAAKYSLTAVASVPLPAGGVLLLSGLGLMALRRKRA